MAIIIGLVFVTTSCILCTGLVIHFQHKIELMSIEAGGASKKFDVALGKIIEVKKETEKMENDLAKVNKAYKGLISDAVKRGFIKEVKGGFHWL